LLLVRGGDPDRRVPVLRVSRASLLAQEQKPMARKAQKDCKKGEQQVLP